MLLGFDKRFELIPVHGIFNHSSDNILQNKIKIVKFRSIKKSQKIFLCNLSCEIMVLLSLCTEIKISIILKLKEQIAGVLLILKCLKVKRTYIELITLIYEIIWSE